MDADLVGASGEGFGGEQVSSVVFSQIFEMSFSEMLRTARDVFISNPYQTGPDRKLTFFRSPITQQDVALADFPPGKLLSEGAARHGAFRKDDQARRGFIEP